MKVGAFLSMKFGLIGKSLQHSFSKEYFTSKFRLLQVDNTYANFEVEHASELSKILEQDMDGFNVTIPYKENIIEFLDRLEEDARAIGAVNTLKKTSQGWVGYNTDAIGFTQSIKPFLTNHHTKALILGTGGASKAINYALSKIGIETLTVSRGFDKGDVTYKEINQNMIKFFKLIVNTTPLGMYPNTTTKPDIPYESLTKEHLLYDLIYNPEETSFLKEGIIRGAETMNGLSMLKLQAEASYKIWTS